MKSFSLYYVKEFLLFMQGGGKLGNKGKKRGGWGYNAPSWFVLGCAGLAFRGSGYLRPKKW